MIGMLQIITYLLCVYLIFKGIEIFQIAQMSSREDRKSGLNLGTAMIFVSILAAGIFYVLINNQAESIQSNIPKLP